MTGFTNGPWAMQSMGDIAVCLSPARAVICTTSKAWTDQGKAEAAANARLIAAAPELYEALKDIAWFCDDPTGSDDPETLAVGLSRLLVSARAALAKARGEQVTA